jgi:hypothetical protein
MRILLVTPLYPPDIAELAPYVKELATRLAPTHTVTILTYGHLPEVIAGVAINAIEKSSILPVRLFRFLIALKKHAEHTDVIYTQNGPSVELPILLFSFISHMPLYLRIGDRVSLKNSLRHTVLKKLLMHTMRRARTVFIHRSDDGADALVETCSHIHSMLRPDSRPEILPFAEFPKEAFTCFEKSWDTHVTELTTRFSL